MNSAEKEVVLHCLRAMIDEELCEECPLYGTTGTDHCEKDCVRLAIEELEQEPCEDAISRKEAISIASIATLSVNQVVTALKKLPSVNPQKPCDKCVYSTSEGCQYDDITETIPPFEPCEDAISRQGVAEVLLKYAHDEVGKRFAEFLVSQINTLPPVSSSEKPNINEVLDKIRTEIEHMIPCSKETLSMKLGVLEIIDKYKAEGSEA